MLNQLKVFVLVIIVMGLVDYLWIGQLMQGFYVEQMRSIGRIGPEDKFVPLMSAAVIVYLFLAFGLFYFVLQGGEAVGAPWTELALKGLLFGLCVYAVYDFTNLATLKDWTWKLALVDAAWGGVLCAATAVLTSLIAEKIR